MRHSAPSICALVLVFACGRIGYDPMDVEQAHLEGGAGAAGGTGGDVAVPGDGASGAASGGTSGAGGSTVLADASSGGASGAGGGPLGTGGTATGGQLGAGGAGSGGLLGAGGAGSGGLLDAGNAGSGGLLDAGNAGSGGLLDAGGTASGGTASGGQSGTGGAYTCAPGATELCDGRDNNCDLVVDEAPACPGRCSGSAWGNQGYMRCDNTSYTWQAAQLECESAGLRLVRIDSQEENDFLYGLAFATRPETYWIGGSDLGAEGDWRWTDGTPFWSGGVSPGGVPIGGSYTHWYAGVDPNNLNSAENADGDCLSFIEPQQGAWVDQGCNYFMRALCEAP